MVDCDWQLWLMILDEVIWLRIGSLEWITLLYTQQCSPTIIMNTAYLPYGIIWYHHHLSRPCSEFHVVFHFEAYNHPGSKTSLDAAMDNAPTRSQAWRAWFSRWPRSVEWFAGNSTNKALGLRRETQKSRMGTKVLDMIEACQNRSCWFDLGRVLPPKQDDASHGQGCHGSTANAHLKHLPWAFGISWVCPWGPDSSAYLGELEGHPIVFFGRKRADDFTIFTARPMFVIPPATVETLWKRRIPHFQRILPHEGDSTCMCLTLHTHMKINPALQPNSRLFLVPRLQCRHPRFQSFGFQDSTVAAFQGKVADDLGVPRVPRFQSRLSRLLHYQWLPSFSRSKFPGFSRFQASRFQTCKGLGLIHQQRSDQRNAKQKKKHNRVVSTYFSRTQCERFQVFNRVLSFQGG